MSGPWPTNQQVAHMAPIIGDKCVPWRPFRLLAAAECALGRAIVVGVEQGWADDDANMAAATHVHICPLSWCLSAARPGAEQGMLALA